MADLSVKQRLTHEIERLSQALQALSDKYQAQQAKLKSLDKDSYDRQDINAAVNTLKTLQDTAFIIQDLNRIAHSWVKNPMTIRHHIENLIPLLYQQPEVAGPLSAEAVDLYIEHVQAFAQMDLSDIEISPSMIISEQDAANFNQLKAYVADAREDTQVQAIYQTINAYQSRQLTATSLSPELPIAKAIVPQVEPVIIPEEGVFPLSEEGLMPEAMAVKDDTDLLSHQNKLAQDLAAVSQ